MADSLTTARGTTLVVSNEDSGIRIRVHPDGRKLVGSPQVALNLTQKEALEFVAMILEQVVTKAEQDLETLEKSIPNNAWSPNS